MKLTENRLKVFAFIRDTDCWLDVNQIAHHCGVSQSLVSRSVRVLAKEGVVARNDKFSAYLYRIADQYKETPLGKELATGLGILDTRAKS